MRRLFLGLCALFLFVSSSYADNPPESFRRHFIIVVDQGACQGSPNMPKLYEDLVLLFNDGVLENQNNPSSEIMQESFLKDSKVFFDPLRDEISVFESGIVETDYFKFSRNYCPNRMVSEEFVNEELVKALLDKKKTFREVSMSNNVTVTEYFEQYLKPLMNSTSQKAQSRSRGTKFVGLNAYLYPLVLLKVNLDTPSEEFCVVLVSNFATQGSDADVRNTQLYPLLAYNSSNNNHKYVDGFDKLVKSLRIPYYQLELFNISRRQTSEADKDKNPKVKGCILGLEKLQNTGLQNRGISRFYQKEYGDYDFQYTSSVVNFNHDDHIKVEHVFLRLAGPDANDTIDMTGKYTFDPTNSNYEFPGGKFYLPKAKIDDVINMKYIFYAQSYDDDGKPLLPMIFTNECQYTLSEADFVPVPKDSNKELIVGIIAALVLFLLIFILIKVRKKRGLKRKAWVEFRVIPVSNSRFMEVKDNKVVNEDCWYMGPDNQNQKISIVGQVNYEDMAFCKKYGYRVEYRVEDADDQEDFTFRPDGIDNKGEKLKKDQWYKLDVKPDGKFKLNVLTYLDTDHSPHLKDEATLRKFFADLEHPYRILILHIHFRILVMDRKTADTFKESFQLPNPDNPDKDCKGIFPRLGHTDMRFEQKYRFIVKPKFVRNTGWVAFDPGTTGSCAAFAISGNPWDPNVVTLSKNQFTVTDSDEKRTTWIYPSVIKIQDRARCFKEEAENVSNVEDWQLGEDFIFGNQANIRLGNNRFKSVKKLLGYTTLLDLKKDNIVRKIMGRDLALMIVKGLYQQVSDYAMESPEVDENVRKDMSDSSGRFSPVRAIVAVPNNYTLLKIQDMVDSVKRLNCFEEVHYLYESEGVIMTYLHRMWSNLSEDDNHKVFVVYDMGGATINATAFSLDIKFDPQTKNITLLTVNTIAKVGYCVGGDDIDYALIRILYDIPLVSDAFGNSEEQKMLNMNQNKQKLIQFVTALKLELIDKKKKTSPILNILGNEEMLINAICQIMKDCGVALDPNSFDDEDKKYLKNQLEKQDAAKSIMTKYVYTKVEDAVGELIADLNKGDVELIFSGRSSLYPHIQDFVKNKMVSCGFQPHVWDGFNGEDGYLDADKVKTAVAEGACWFALFNTIIRLDHSVITSSFGYIDQEGGKAKFVPVVKRLEKFKDGKMSHKVEPIDKGLNNVKFVQMLGADYDKILDDFYNTKNNRHKINILDEVRAMSVNGSIETIEITIEDNNNFTYDVETTADHIHPENNSYSRLVGHAGSVVKTEIIDENNESYVFAAMQSVDEKFNEGGGKPRTSSTTSTRSSKMKRRDDLLEGMESTDLPSSDDSTPTDSPSKSNKKTHF